MPLRSLLESIGDPALVARADGVVIDANDAMVQAAAGHEVVGRYLSTLLAAQGDRSHLAGSVDEWLGSVVEGRRLRLTPGHGDEVAVDVSMVPVADASRHTLVVTAPTTDMSRPHERDRALRRLAEAEALAELGSWEWDVVADEVYWSAQLCRLLGVDPAEAEPSYDAYMAAVHPDDRQRWQADVRAVFDRDTTFDSDHRVVRPDGAVREVRARAAVIRDDGGAPVRLLGSILDVTEQREIERRKDEFVSVVSHELRTPLTSISGALGLLDSGTTGELPARAQRMIQIARNNSDRLVRLINDILDLERIRSGRVELTPETLDMARAVADALVAMQPAAVEAGVELVSNVGPGVSIVADADRLQQVLTNLLSNAIKFSPREERVTVSAWRDGADVVLTVTDHGRGIPAHKLEEVFGRFEQVDASDTREQSGTGLGLAICRTIVEEHGGTIRADSQPGQGTTVRVGLPATVELADAPGPGRPLVLVCDDEPDARAIAKATIEQAGYRVVTARDGDEALRQAAQEHPAAMVLDLVMPGGGGWQTAAALKQDPATADIPVVILSALPVHDALRPAGLVTDWVDKAMLDADLVGAVDRAVGAGGEQQGGGLLLVEDDDELAGVLAEAFRGHGLSVTVAADGAEAERLAEHLRPDVLVLDLLLPERDGFAVIDTLRRQCGLRHTPLVVYTALDLDRDQRQALRLGPTEHCTKGRVSLAELEHRVLSLLAQVAPHVGGPGADGSSG